ncbi:MAG: hypothetical protein AVDCRST_MAG13-3974, partial [uncultured Solirubrobacteraceae bacterium]
ARRPPRPRRARRRPGELPGLRRVLLRQPGPDPGRLARARAAGLRDLPLPAGARVLPHPARRLSRRAHRLPADLGRLRRRLRLQQRHPGARRGRHQALPHAPERPALELPGDRRGLRGRARLRRRDGRLHPELRLLPGRLPQAAGLRQPQRLRPLVLRGEPALHAVPAHRARGPRARGVRPAQRPREGVLGPRAPGPDHPARPAPLPARGLPRPVRGLGIPVHGLLVHARGLQRRRLGAQRPARARRQRGGRGGPVHPGRGGRPAGVPGEGLRGHGGRGDDRRLLRGPADRDRVVLHRARVRGDLRDLPVPLVQGGHRGGTRRAGRRARARGRRGRARV